MKVKEMIEKLSEMPEDAEVWVVHELCNDEHEVERIEFGKFERVWIGELPEGR